MTVVRNKVLLLCFQKAIEEICTISTTIPVSGSVCLSAEDATALDTSGATELNGVAGSLTIHNCRVLHSSMPNKSSISRPLLLNAYSAADAMPYTPVPTPSKYYQTIVRGSTARWAHHDSRPCQIPPDWSSGYTSIFSLQQEEASM